jgi:hypothetical protein
MQQQQQEQQQQQQHQQGGSNSRATERRQDAGDDSDSDEDEDDPEEVDVEEVPDVASRQRSIAPRDAPAGPATATTAVANYSRPPPEMPKLVIIPRIEPQYTFHHPYPTPQIRAQPYSTPQSRDQGYKTFYGRKLEFCPWQTFPA